MNANVTPTEVNETKMKLHGCVLAVRKAIISALIINEGNGEDGMLGWTTDVSVSF